MLFSMHKSSFGNPFPPSNLGVKKGKKFQQESLKPSEKDAIVNNLPLKLTVSLPLKIDSDWALQKEMNHLPTIEFQTLIGFLRVPGW